MLLGIVMASLLVCWNPLSLKEEGRLDDISAEFSKAAVIILNGTGRKSAPDLPCWRQGTVNNRATFVGWGNHGTVTRVQESLSSSTEG